MQLYTKILLGMLFGVVLGVLVGPASPLLPHDGVRLAPGATVSRTAGGTERLPEAPVLRVGTVARDADAGPIEVRFQLSNRDVMRLAAKGIERKADVVTGWVDPASPTVTRYSTLGQSLVDATEWIGRLFLALIKMVVVPLVFFSLVVGVASLGDVRKLGRLGALTLGYFTATTVVALVIGLGLANLVCPGAFVGAKARATLMASYSGDASGTVAAAAEAPTLVDNLLGIIPSNPFAALASGDMLAVIGFAALLGVALTLLGQEKAGPTLAVFDTLNDAMVQIVHMAMALAPYGVAALLFQTVGSTGLSVLIALIVYTAVVLAGLLIHATVTYGLVVTLGARRSFPAFLLGIRDALVLAFSTSSSSATLPVTKTSCEERLGVREEIASFVLPIGATVNMDGTALYQGVAALFISQIYGMDLTLSQQATIVLSATLASVGAAGVPGAGIVTLAMVLTTVGVPTSGIALILGVDRLLDMFRTLTNVVGDATATVLVDRLAE